MTRCAKSRPVEGCSPCKSSRMACRHALECKAQSANKSQLKPSDLTALVNRSPVPIGAIITNRSMRSQNRTSSSPLLRIGDERQSVQFEEHDHAHGPAHRDNNMRAAVVHVFADAAVSVLVIVGLLLARAFGWLWMDPSAGIVGACVIASWSYGLVRDTGAILLDMNPDRRMEGNIRSAVESGGDQLADLHLWRLGPGHLGAILAVATDKARNADHYRGLLRRFKTLSHVTIEIVPARV